MADNESLEKLCERLTKQNDSNNQAISRLEHEKEMLQKKNMILDMEKKQLTSAMAIQEKITRESLSSLNLVTSSQAEEIQRLSGEIKELKAVIKGLEKKILQESKVLTGSLD